MIVQTTRVFDEISFAKDKGYIVVSEQGGSRSSKTYNTTIWIVYYCLTRANKLVSIVRKTLPALKGSVLRDFLQVVDSFGVFNRQSFNKSELIYTFPNGSAVEFFSCDSEQKLRGRKRDVLFVNEANELSFLEWQQLRLRTTEFAIVDFNPSISDEHWLCELNRDSRTYHFITTYKDNPFLEKTLIDEIESLQRKNKSLWQIYGLGQQAMVEGLVFRNVEIVQSMPDNLKHYWLGMDLGFANDPTAISLVGFDGENLYVDEVCYRTQMLTSDIIRELKAFPNIKVISESADPRLIQEVYRAGINIHPVKKYAGSIEAGVTKMQELNIKVTIRSTNIKKEFNNYVYQQDKEGKWLNTCIDAYNHAIDGIRYVVMEEIMGGERRHLSSKQWEDLAY